jgi:hypothetical protein
MSPTPVPVNQLQRTCLVGYIWISLTVFLFLAFFRKILINTSLTVRFQKMDPPLGAIVIGANIKRLGASPIGAKLLAHVGVDAELAVTWQPTRRQLYWRKAWLHDHWRKSCYLP